MVVVFSPDIEATSSGILLFPELLQKKVLIFPLPKEAEGGVNILFL
jgi:hypothetical protein